MENYGFVYIWYDKNRKMFYIGSHWGTENDGYICSSNWMRTTYNRRPYDFKRRIISKIFTNRVDLLKEEEKWLSMIKDCEMIKSNTTNKSRKNVRYYNISKSVKNPWHSTEDGVKTVGQKISAAKKGKSTGPCSPEKAAKISKIKKQKFAERGGISEEHREKLKLINVGRKHSNEWKQQNSERMKEQWSNGTRKRAEPKQTMTREEQDKLCSEQLKNRWSDPVWAANQRKLLSEGAKKRPPRSEESKLKARLSQLGKPKHRKIINSL